TGLLQPGQPAFGTGQFQIVVTDLSQIEVVGEATAPATRVEKPFPKDAKPEQKVLTPEQAIELKPKEKVTVQFKVTSAQTFQISRSNVVGKSAGTSGEGCSLKDGDSFAVQLRPPVMDTIRRLGIEPDKHFQGKVVQ